MIRTLDKNSQQLLVDLFYRIGTLYYGYSFGDREGRVKYFFAQLRKIEFEIWEKVIQENKKFNPVSITLPTRSNRPITLELQGNFQVNSEFIHGYKLSAKKAMFHHPLTLHIGSCLIDVTDESKGRNWGCEVIFDSDGSNPHKVAIEGNGSTDEENIVYEEEFIDQVQGFFLTNLLIPATIQ